MLPQCFLNKKYIFGKVISTHIKSLTQKIVPKWKL